MFIGSKRSKMTSIMVDYSSCDSPYRSVEQQGDEYSPDIVDTLRILKAEIKSCKVDNDMFFEG